MKAATVSGIKFTATMTLEEV